MSGISVTVRKTLDSPESEADPAGARFALAISKDDINNRLVVNYEIKQRNKRKRKNCF